MRLNIGWGTEHWHIYANYFFTVSHTTLQQKNILSLDERVLKKYLNISLTMEIVYLRENN